MYINCPGYLYQNTQTVSQCQRIKGLPPPFNLGGVSVLASGHKGNMT